jgi:hypothetical protein
MIAGDAGTIFFDGHQEGVAATYLCRAGSHLVVRLMLQGKPIVAYYPVSLVERWRPDPIDCTTVAFGDERMSPSMPISERASALGKFVKNGIT